MQGKKLAKNSLIKAKVVIEMSSARQQKFETRPSKESVKVEQACRQKQRKERYRPNQRHAS